MTDIVKGPLTRDPPAATEEQVRAELFSLASELINKARNATQPAEVQVYAETAAVVFGAAASKMTDVPPDGGRIAARAPSDVPPDRG